jgi:hypothetical protein
MLMKWYASLAAIALSCAIAACDSAAGADVATRLAKQPTDASAADSIARARQDSINRLQPGYVVDSVLPVEEELRRFRARVGGDSTTAFAYASPSRDALVARIVRGVARRDSVDLIHALVSPREFADIIYPSSQYTRAPYRQSPELVWMAIASHSNSGYVRLLRRRGAGDLRLAGYNCDETPEVQGENTFWTGCVVRLIGAKGDTTSQRWFGSIVERQGRFKLMSFRNQF